MGRDSFLRHLAPRLLRIELRRPAGREDLPLPVHHRFVGRFHRLLRHGVRPRIPPRFSGQLVTLARSHATDLLAEVRQLGRQLSRHHHCPRSLERCPVGYHCL